MDEQTRRRLERYQPNRPEIFDALGDTGIELVRTVVAKSDPSGPGEADRRASHIATYLHRALNAGAKPRTRDAFSLVRVREVLELAEAEGWASSPWRSDVCAVARAVTPGAVQSAPASLAQTRNVDPYSSDELVRLLDARNGMEDPAAAGHTAAVALGAGAGCCGPAADGLTAASLIPVGTTLVVVAAGRPPVALSPRWADELRRVAEAHPTGPLTEAYDSAGRQRHRRAMRKGHGSPDFDSHRLHATWMLDLLERRLSVAVIAAAAGVQPRQVSVYGQEFMDAAGYTRPSIAEQIDWLSTTGTAAPPPLPDGFALPTIPDAVHEPVDVARFLATYRPVGDAARREWEAGYGAEITALAQAMPGATAINAVKAAASQLAWAIENPDLEATPDVLLSDTVIERFSRHGAPRRSRADYRSRLRSLARAKTGLPATHATSTTCRSGGAAVDPAPARLADPRDRYLHCQQVLGLGAGMWPHEIDAARPDHVERLPNGTVIHVGGRVVPIASGFAAPLHHLIESTAPGAYLHGGRSTRNGRKRSGLTVDLASHRRGWQAQHLRRGVPYDIVSLASGDPLRNLDDLLASTPTPTAETVVAWTAVAHRVAPPLR